MDTADQIRFLSKKSGLSITETLSEIIGSVFQISCTFDALNLEYEFDISKAQVLISAHGKNKMKSGSFDMASTMPNSRIDDLVNKKVFLNE